MRRIAMVVVCLAALACAQGTYTGGATWNGGGVLGNGYVHGSPGGDLPLPDFTAQGGVPLSLPQLWVDPMEPFVQGIDQTIYVGASANGCPTNTPTGACTYYSGDASGKNPLQEASDNWCAAPDQRWDVRVTHGTSYNFGSGAWMWCTKYNGTPPTRYLVFHSDCTASTPCSGANSNGLTNDLGYNPLGRLVLSHGINDMLSPPLPSMGQRNHGGQGFLGFPGVDYPMPIAPPTPSSPGPYTYDPNYNDVANMFTITSNLSNINNHTILMGPASTSGGAQLCDNAGGSGNSPCPVEGVNHIILQDAHIVPGSGSNTAQHFTPVSLRSQEWENNGSLQTSGWMGAVPNHVGIATSYFEGGTDDDGYGPFKLVRFIQLACAYCFLTHTYIDGVKYDGTEDHAITSDDSPGPVMLSDIWCEGSSICYWGGGGGNPAIRDQFPHDFEVRRMRNTYNMRWYPQPAGDQTAVEKVSGGSCTGGTTLSLTIPNSGSAITNSVVYLGAIKDSGGANICGTTGCEGWYTASTLDSTHVVVTVSSCTGTPASGKVYGWTNNYLGPVSVTAAAMNGAGKDPTTNNPVEKDKWESKAYYRVLADGLILENAAVDGQEGQCSGQSSRGYSGIAYDSGDQEDVIQDVTITNSICRNATSGMLISARSGGESRHSYSITGISCIGTNQAIITAPNANNNMVGPPNYLPDLSDNCSPNGHTPCTGPSVGADVYLTGIGANGGGGGSPLIPAGWYTTAYPTNGNYGNDTTLTIMSDPDASGAVCTTSGGNTNSGTIYAVTGSNGNGVTKPMRRMVYQNLLIYGIGDHQKNNGSGTATLTHPQSAGNNYTVTVTVNPDGVTATATVQAIDACPASKACPMALQAQTGDGAYLRCPDPAGLDRFSSTVAGGRGAPMLSVTNDQLSFTYTPRNAASPNQLHAGDSVTCPMETPDSPNDVADDSGYYNFQSYPWPFYWSHVTAIGVNGMDIAFGSNQSQFNKYGNFLNSFQLVPSLNDIAANDYCQMGSSYTNNCNNLNYGFLAEGSETYSPSDATGVTNGNDRTTLTMKSYALSARSIHNYLMFPCGSPSSSGCDTGGNPASYGGTNSVPTNVATTGTSVTCNNGHACNSTNYIPDSVGFAGAMNTHNYPFSLADFRQYALDPSSPYAAGGILQATDSLDSGAQIPLIVNALSRTQYICGLPCGAGPHGDGPQYGFLQWSPYVGAVNYRVYRDGGAAPASTVTTTWFNDYGLPSGSHTWTVKAWDGSAEHVVSGLTSEMF